jgi:hypothetical protein
MRHRPAPAAAPPILAVAWIALAAWSATAIALLIASLRSLRKWFDRRKQTPSEILLREGRDER